MPQILCALLIAALAMLGACANARPVRFQTLAAETGEPIRGARVTVHFPLPGAFTPRDVVAFTDDSGVAQRDVPSARRMDVAVDCPGYRPLMGAVFHNDQMSWTMRDDPTRVLNPDARPASLLVTASPEGPGVDFTMRLEWEPQPTHVITLPPGFRGLVLLTRAPGAAPLPERPAPRVFPTALDPNGAALIPEWPITEAPYEKFVFLTQDAARIPETPAFPSDVYVAKLREGARTLLYLVGDSHDESVMRRALWVFSPTGASDLNEDHFAFLVQMITQSMDPVTAREYTGALWPQQGTTPAPWGGSS